jgi:hypothetical protein
MQGPNPDRLVERALSFDRDGDGKLNRDELMEFAKSMPMGGGQRPGMQGLGNRGPDGRGPGNQGPGGPPEGGPGRGRGQGAGPGGPVPERPRRPDPESI